MNQENNYKDKYYNLLRQSCPTKENIAATIIEAKARLQMPKYTEHFVSDLHGEYESFTHVVRNGSGVIASYIDELFTGQITTLEKRHLATLIYYPEKYIQHFGLPSDSEKQKNLLLALIAMTQRVSSKYPHEKVRKAYPESLSIILDDLLFDSPDNLHKYKYYHTILEEIWNTEQENIFIIALCHLIQRFAVETLHVIGDIYDRGDDAVKIMDFLVQHQDADVQWGNHDIAWIGAALGSKPLICNVIRIAARYRNLSTIEDDYGINLSPLYQFANKTYTANSIFYPKGDKTSMDNELISKVHKAITVLQFKTEAAVIKQHPEYEVDEYMLLHRMDLEKGIIHHPLGTFPLLDYDFPTIDPEDPYRLTEEESFVIEHLQNSFQMSGRLQKHLNFLIQCGSMYKIQNDNVLFHGCIPMTEDGDFLETNFLNKPLKGKALLDALDHEVRSYHQKKKNTSSLDVLWYLWCGKNSPLFGKNKITTFERYFIEDFMTHRETKNPYFTLRKEETIAEKVLEEFSISSEVGKVINGHTPVKLRRGESPIKANGKVIVIDGGFAKSYRSKTGIAGYTLISNSYGIILAAHEPLDPAKDQVSDLVEITSHREFVTKYPSRRLVVDTDLGEKILEQIADLEYLLNLEE